MRAAGWAWIEGGGYDRDPVLRCMARGRRIRGTSQQHDEDGLKPVDQQWGQANASHAFCGGNENGLARGGARPLLHPGKPERRKRNEPQGREGTVRRVGGDVMVVAAANNRVNGYGSHAFCAGKEFALRASPSA